MVCTSLVGFFLFDITEQIFFEVGKKPLKISDNISFFFSERHGVERLYPKPLFSTVRKMILRRSPGLWLLLLFYGVLLQISFGFPFLRRESYIFLSYIIHSYNCHSAETFFLFVSLTGQFKYSYEPELDYNLKVVWWK